MFLSQKNTVTNRLHFFYGIVLYQSLKFLTLKFQTIFSVIRKVYRESKQILSGIQCTYTLIRNHPFRTYVKFSEKSCFLTLDTHMYVFVSGGKC